MQQLNLYVQEVIKENTELRIRLQFEERNNQMLLRQISNIQSQSESYDNQVSNQPRKPSGKIDQKLNQKDITFENYSDGGNPNLDEEKQDSPRFNQHEEL